MVPLLSDSSNIPEVCVCVSFLASVLDSVFYFEDPLPMLLMYWLILRNVLWIAFTYEAIVMGACVIAVR